MRKLVVVANPVNPFEIFEIDDGKFNHLTNHQWSRQALDFIKTYAEKAQEEIDITFMGPANYIDHFVKEANKFKFVKASASEDDYVKISN